MTKSSSNRKSRSTMSFIPPWRAVLAPVAIAQNPTRLVLAEPKCFPTSCRNLVVQNDSIILKGASWGYTTYTSPDPLSNRKKNLVMRQKGLRKNTLANLKHTRSMLESNKFTLSKYFNALTILPAKTNCLSHRPPVLSTST